ncbi:MAG: GYF domain-containing protein, partial [Fimbriimonas sp.]
PKDRPECPFLPRMHRNRPECHYNEAGQVGDWYYIGHYGQLGPLTREQIDELIDGGVISQETYVWKNGMSDWLPAERVPELRSSFQRAEPYGTPPPPPSPGGPFPGGPVPGRPNPYAPAPPVSSPRLNPVSPYGTDMSPVNYGQAGTGLYSSVRSDRSRALAGVLQILLPGVGRIYLGYAAIGVLQLVLSPCFVGVVWSVIDGIIILTGGLKMDGYGRQLND